MVRDVGEMIEPRREIGVLGRLHQPEMTFRQRKSLVAWQRTEHRNVERGERVRHHRAMARTTDPVEDHACDPHRGIMRRKSPHHRGRGLRLAVHVEHQHHRQAEMVRKVGGAAAAAGRSGDPVEQAHHALD